MTLHRRVFEDLAADEMLPTGYTNAEVLWAKTQLIHNSRSRVRSNLDGSSWAQGWLVQRLIDPRGRQRFARQPEQLSAVSSYLTVGEKRKSMKIYDALQMEREDADGGPNKKQGKDGKKGGGQGAYKDV